VLQDLTKSDWSIKYRFMPSVKKKPKTKAAAPARHATLRLGAHLSLAGGMANALREAVRLKIGVLQVFVKNQRQWRAPPLKPDDLAEWQKLREKHGFDAVVAHATYLINLASPDEALHQKSRLAFAEELARCDALDIPCLVVHPGAAGEQTAGDAVRRVSAALNRVFQENPDLKAMPLLETTAGQGTTLGRNFKELGEIIRLLDEPTRVGVCIDTCHVFAAGYDIREPSDYERMIREARREVGLKRIRCWHLNDSKGECGEHLDRHAHIGHGAIGAAGFRNVLRDERFHGLPMILETPKGANEKGREWDRVNLSRLRRIANN